MVKRAKKAVQQQQVKRGRGRPPGRQKAVIKPARKVDKAPEIAMRKNVKVDAESKKLFLDIHLPKIARLKALLATASANLRNALKTAKSDGFLQRDFDVAFRLQTETGEKAIKLEIARDCTIAGWLGYSLGKQLDLFLQDDMHDTEMMAYADGEEASRIGKPAAPIYAPGTSGYDAYMQGFHDHQEELHKGFKPSVDEVSSTSGVSMTRSQFRAQQTKQAADAAEERSQLFTKKPQQPESAA